MIVQTAPDGKPHFISTMIEHMDLCGQIARAFGNETFEPIEDGDALYAIDNHDRGWDDYDQHPGLDVDTRLPYLMVQTPIDDTLKTNRGSPEFNERHSPYSGLLSSMHTWGLYNRRYGFSQFEVRTLNSISAPIPPENKVKIVTMLTGELQRQKRLRGELVKQAAARDEQKILQNYKHLQFCDTLALYFQLRHSSERSDETYIHVPKNKAADASIALKKIDDTTYSLAPFPFASDSASVLSRGRYMHPIPVGKEPNDLGVALRKLPADVQSYRLVPG